MRGFFKTPFSLLLSHSDHRSGSHGKRRWQWAQVWTVVQKKEAGRYFCSTGQRFSFSEFLICCCTVCMSSLLVIINLLCESLCASSSTLPSLVTLSFVLWFCRHSRWQLRRLGWRKLHGYYGNKQCEAKVHVARNLFIILRTSYFLN